VSVPFLAAANVYAALEPGESVDTVRRAFVEHARGSWFMPSKVYVPAPPDGDFRAMPASGGGFAVLKWVTSFPRNPERGLPTVAGLVLVSDAGTGELRAALDAGAVTALRTGAAAVLAAETLARDTSSPAAVIGCGVNGRAVARTFVARGRSVVLWDARPEQAEALAGELGGAASVAPERADALAADVVATVTPGAEIVVPPGSLRPGQHASLMGADGPGKAEIAVEELLRARVVVDERQKVDPNGSLSKSTDAPGRMRLFCDEWDQASHAGDLARAVQAGKLGREDVTELGDVLIGAAEGRQSEDDITVFDSTGLAIQDLAAVIAIYERWREEPRAEAFAGVSEIDFG
jgi:ornithine cyclodeaminase/alanine dehydrogenase-like protein (mu-crystallin family)